jgi:3-hydroxyacyl-[acyl-carrier-protein] dehydratase
VLRASVGRAPGDDRVPVLARIVRFRFLRPVLPGTVLEHHVRIEASTSDGAVFEGGTWVNGEQVASVDRIVAALAPKF